jgi:hypothetical protein
MLPSWIFPSSSSSRSSAAQHLSDREKVEKASMYIPKKSRKTLHYKTFCSNKQETKKREREGCEQDLATLPTRHSRSVEILVEVVKFKSGKTIVIYLFPPYTRKRKKRKTISNVLGNGKLSYEKWKARRKKIRFSNSTKLLMIDNLEKIIFIHFLCSLLIQCRFFLDFSHHLRHVWKVEMFAPVFQKHYHAYLYSEEPHVALWMENTGIGKGIKESGKTNVLLMTWLAPFIHSFPTNFPHPITLSSMQ